MISTSLITDALIFIFMLWVGNDEDIDERVLFDAKETFKFVAQLYFMATERFFKMAVEPKDKEIKLTWGWEGAIKDDRSAVEVQHEILRWRVER